MLYDLNIAWSPSVVASDLERTLKFAKNLGYDVVALNHTVSGSIPTLPSPITNPIPTLTPPHPSYPNNRTATSTNLSTTAATGAPPPTVTSPDTSANLPTVLRRVTLVVTDPATTNYRLPDFARAYDLLAVRPANEKAFSWACLATTEPPALISLDLTAFLGWHIHHRTAMAAVHRGTRFEISYSQALSGDSRARSNFIGNVLGLLRATKGRGIIVSSEARSALGLRGPADVVNLMAVWGLGPERGSEAMEAGARAVVVNEGIKRRGFRGVVDIVATAPGGTDPSAATAAARDAERNNNNNGKRLKGTAGGGQKRKYGGGGGGGDGAASVCGGGDGQQTLSKRQAKKMKNEAAEKKENTLAGGGNSK
ncbi:RNase P subunit p30-domain-containing protein [Podospora didyma]|uniref:RNase P subunit p30-domain-containing protein n=1 Tax=Podospora didyma TaxID=330526 RepID=A0AAE0U7R6_9PEZI|nr:RNase P subunit p30-domain-containing protein [Podospora didyma]